MSRVYDTLFYPLNAGGGAPPLKDHAVLFINAALCGGLDLLSASNLSLQQYSKPYGTALRDQGYVVASDIPADGAQFDYVFIAAPKNKLETQYVLAEGARLLREGGTLVCAASNNTGGGRLAGFLQTLGFENIRQESKYKARVVWAQRQETLADKQIEEWRAAGGVQGIVDGKFFSAPGLFCWDKIDKGSEILTQNLPENMIGSGADFGCGYGYLSSYLLQHNPAIENLICVDADFRAVAACRMNLDRLEHRAQKRYFWEDLTKPVATLRDLDWIVMNPPFHEGKDSNIGIGQACIETAAKSLRPGGKLWMVANVGLPYEKVLESAFKTCCKKFEGKGYKVFVAEK